MLDAAADLADTVRGPAVSYAAGTVAGYATATVRRASATYRDSDDPLQDDAAVITAGLLAAEEYVSRDPVALAGFVSGVAAEDRVCAALDDITLEEVDEALEP